MASAVINTWTITLGSSAYNAGAKISVGADGSIYVSGGKLGVTSETDTYITKYGSNGQKIWTKSYATASTEIGAYNSVGPDGSIYVTGATNGPLFGVSSIGGYDSYLTKYNSTGSQVWTKLLGTSSSDFSLGIATSSDGSIYIGGYTDGSLDGQQNAGNFDAFIAKFGSDGTKVWTQLVGSSVNDLSTSLSIGIDGSVYVTGTTYGSMNGLSNGQADGFLTKYSSSGTKIWTKQFGSSGNELPLGITTGLDGSIYICGGTDGNLDGLANSGSFDIFVTKYSQDGTKVWTKLLGTSGSDTAYSITTGIDGSIYIAGTTAGSLDGKLNSGDTDGFLVKYAPDGSKIWTELIDTSSEDTARFVAVGPDGSIFVTGYTEGQLNGQSVIGADIYITKFQSTNITKKVTNLSVIVDKGIIGSSAVLLKNLIETSTYTDGVITNQVVEYAGNIFNYLDIDKLITTVTRDGDFTSEFRKEISELLPAAANFSYQDTIKLVGTLNIDNVILYVAGADGNFVG